MTTKPTQQEALEFLLSDQFTDPRAQLEQARKMARLALENTRQEAADELIKLIAGIFPEEPKVKYPDETQTGIFINVGTIRKIRALIDKRQAQAKLINRMKAQLFRARNMLMLAVEGRPINFKLAAKLVYAIGETLTEAGFIKG